MASGWPLSATRARPARLISSVVLGVVWLSAGSQATPLEYTVPDGWVTRASASSMRVAEFELPGDTPDASASLVVYYFGGQGGSVEANLDRWIGQMTQPDGRPSQSVAQSTTFRSNDLDVTLLEVTGTYVAEIRPGAAARHHLPDAKLLAAVIETPEGPYFIKMVGPRDTVERWQRSVRAFLDTAAYRAGAS